MLTNEQINALLVDARYLGAGAEGLALRSGNYVIKFWFGEDDFNSYDIWREYSIWPDYVKDVAVKMYYCGNINGQPVTITELVEEIESREDNVVPTDIITALVWFSEKYGFNLEDMIYMPNLGKRGDKILLFDIC